MAYRTLWVQTMVLPPAMFAAIVIFFTYAYHWQPLLPWIAAGSGIILATFGTWPVPKLPSTSPVPIPRTIWDFAPAIMNNLMVFAAVLVGLSTYSIITPWVHLRFLNRYTSVRPGAPPGAYTDAGVLAFSPDARLDATRSVGFEDWPHRYCVAPIVNPGFPEPSTFWAGGIDCCDVQGDFWCGDAYYTHSTSKAVGIRMYSGTDVFWRALGGPALGDVFRKAARMGGAKYGLEVPLEPIIVWWVMDPGAIEAWAITKASIWVAVSVFLALVVSTMVSRIVIASHPHPM